MHKKINNHSHTAYFEDNSEIGELESMDGKGKKGLPLDVVRELKKENEWNPDDSQKRQQIEQWIQEVCDLYKTIDPDFTSFPAAVEALQRYGGLAITTGRPGVEMYRDPFVLDPKHITDPEQVVVFAKGWGKNMFPIRRVD